MNRKHFFLIAILALVGSFAFAQDLKVEYQFDVTRTGRMNYLTFTGPIRYMAVDKDHFDATTGASVLGSTHFFQPYRVDVLGKNVLADGMRGLFLYGVAGNDTAKEDNLTVTKANDGTITIQYAHRGTAYKIVTDKNGNINFPNGTFQKRAIGFIVGAGPQVISRDFSRNGAADGIDWAKVWSTSIAGGKEVQAGNAAKTGNIVADGADPASMFYWQGSLQATFTNNVLAISGGLSVVKR